MLDRDERLTKDVKMSTNVNAMHSPLLENMNARTSTTIPNTKRVIPMTVENSWLRWVSHRAIVTTMDTRPRINAPEI